MVEEAGTVKCKTTKEIKAMARPEFAANPEQEALRAQSFPGTFRP